MDQILLRNELKLMRKTVRSFVQKHVIPVEPPENSPQEVLDRVSEKVRQKAKQSGLWLFGVKEEWGGAGLNLLERAVLLEEAASHRFGFYRLAFDAFGKDLPGFLDNCTEEQFRLYVKPAVMSGNGCFMAIWETDESNDLCNLQCSAQKKGSQWIIQGTKSYVQDAATAEFGIILANCFLENGEKKAVLFFIERDDPGVSWKQGSLMDVHIGYELNFENVLLPDSRRLGEIGEGMELVEQWLAESRILMAARCIGISRKALEMGMEYAALRITRGQTLSEYPTIRALLAASATELQAARLLVWDAAIKSDEKRGDRSAACMAKYAATETASRIIDRVIQIHGGAGLTNDLPFQRWYKELRVARLDLGSTETMHECIANAEFLK